MYRFALNINREQNGLSPEDGLAYGDLGVLINQMNKAINPKDGIKCTLSGIENHGYTPHFVTNSERQYSNFIQVHRDIQEKEIKELRKDEAVYANTLRKILSKDNLYVEPLDNENKPLFRLTKTQIGQGVKSYATITTKTGIITEIGSPTLNETRHIYLHNCDYKIFISPEQEEQLKDKYRKGTVELKLKQKHSFNTGRIVSAKLISFKIKPELTLAESLSTLSDEELASLGNFETTEDILNLLRS